MNRPTARRVTGADRSEAVILAGKVGRQNAARMLGIPLSDIPSAVVTRERRPEFISLRLQSPVVVPMPEATLAAAPLSAPPAESPARPRRRRLQKPAPRREPLQFTAPTASTVVEVPPAVLALIDDVASRYGLTGGQLRAPAGTIDNPRAVTVARALAMCAVRETFGLSYPQIGRIFGGRDHTTAFHNIRRHEARMAWAEVLRSMTHPKAPMTEDEAKAALERHLRVCDIAKKGNDEGAALWRDAAAAIRWLAKRAQVDL